MKCYVGWKKGKGAPGYRCKFVVPALGICAEAMLMELSSLL